MKAAALSARASALVISALALALALALSAGCSSAAATDPGMVSESPAAIVTSDSGGYRISVHSAPDALPSRGNNTLRLDVTKISDGTAASGLALDIVPWMPAMGHGTSVKPTVAPGTEAGSYDVTNVNLFMPGLWEIRTTIAGATSTTVSDHVAPQFDIQ